MPRCTTVYSSSLINENVRSKFGKICGFIHPRIFTAVNSRRRKVQNRKKISGHSWEGRTTDCSPGANKSCGTTTHDTHNRQISMPPVGFEPAAARLLRSWVRIPPVAWIFVCCECRVLSGRGLCDELITRPEESYRLCCLVVCDLETSRICAPYIYIYI